MKVEPQDCVALPEHCTWPVVHAPLHAPLTHVLPPLHETVAPHKPLVPQVWTPVASEEHCTAPG
jgi:hypothetical protein